MKPRTIEERAEALGLSVEQFNGEVYGYGYGIYDLRDGTALDLFPSRRAVAKWLDGAEAMAHIMEERLGAGL